MRSTRNFTLTATPEAVDLAVEAALGDGNFLLASAGAGRLKNRVKIKVMANINLVISFNVIVVFKICQKEVY